MRDRVRALELLDESPGTNSVDALVRATRCPEVEVQAAAAWGLMWEEAIADHRAMLEELSASWPVADAPWEVTRVRDMLNAAWGVPGARRDRVRVTRVAIEQTCRCALLSRRRQPEVSHSETVDVMRITLWVLRVGHARS